MEEQAIQLSQKDGSNAREKESEESSEGSSNEDGGKGEEGCDEVAPRLVADKLPVTRYSKESSEASDAGDTKSEESSEGRSNEDGQGDEEKCEEVAPELVAQEIAVKRDFMKKPLTCFKKIAVSNTMRNLPFVLGIGTIILDVLINLAANDISNEVQGRHVVVRLIPYFIWFALTLLWVAVKRRIRRVSSLRKYEAFMVFGGWVSCDVLINFICNDISGEVQQQTFVGERFLPYALLFTATIIWFVIKRRVDIQQAPMPQGIFQLNDSVWELHPPAGGIPKVDILFFHGLPLSDSKDAFWKTWLARDNEQLVWAKEWLGEALPNARILSVSYHHSLANKTDGELDVNFLMTNLVNDIVLAKHLKIGANCPVILVGHSLGGIVIKEFLLTVNRMKRRVVNLALVCIDQFLSNVAGLFYYATPHADSRITELQRKIEWDSPTLELLKAINTKAPVINAEFREDVLNFSSIRTFGLAEGIETKYLGFHARVVEEASARVDVDQFYTAVTADHFAVCRPAFLLDSKYKLLESFIAAASAYKILPQTKNIELKVPICCEECTESVGRALLNLEGYRRVNCDIAVEKVTVVVTTATNPYDVLLVCRTVLRKSRFWTRYD